MIEFEQPKEAIYYYLLTYHLSVIGEAQQKRFSNEEKFKFSEREKAYKALKKKLDELSNLNQFYDEPFVSLGERQELLSHGIKGGACFSIELFLVEYRDEENIMYHSLTEPEDIEESKEIEKFLIREFG